MKGEALQGQPLLTDDELRTQLVATLKSGFVEHGNMFLPTTALYNRLHTNQGLHTVFMDMCRWLGLKPGQVTVTFSGPKHTASDLYKSNTVTIDKQCKDHPYAAGALLAFAAIMYYHDHYNDKVPTMDFVEFASIETGLGVWIINGLRPKTKNHRAVYNTVKGLWLHNDGLALTRYNPELYAHNVAQYAHQNHIAEETYIPSISPSHQYLLPAMATQKTNRSLPEPTIILKHRTAARQLWLRYVIIAAIFASIISFGLYFWHSNDPAVSAQQQQSEQALGVIKQSLTACQDKAIDQQNKFDPNDLFMARQIDATKARCKSLLNEYNYALNQHQSLYDQ